MAIERNRDKKQLDIINDTVLSDMDKKERTTLFLTKRTRIALKKLSADTSEPMTVLIEKALKKTYNI